MRWILASERLPRAGVHVFVRSIHTKSGGMMWAEELAKLEELHNVEWLDEFVQEGWVEKQDELWEDVENILLSAGWNNERSSNSEYNAARRELLSKYKLLPTPPSSPIK